MTNKTFQFLRNKDVITEKGTYVDVHAAAIAKLNTQLDADTTLDGQAVLVRYNDGSKERTILGIKGKTGNEIFDNVGSNDAIDTAIAKLIGGASEDFNTLKEIEDVIKAMDKDANAENGKVVTTVSEANGVVSETKANVKDLQLGGYSKDASATGDIASTDTINAALSKLENKSAATTVKSSDKTVKITDNGGKDLAVNIDGTTIVKDGTTGILSSGLSIAKETEGLESNVREQYKLVDADGNAISGAKVIKIYKDSALYRVYLGHTDDTITSTTDPTVVPGKGDTALCFIYQKADGTYELVAINVESFLQESEFKNGLQVVNHEVSVKKDAASGQVRTAAGDAGLVDVLTVSSEGVKVDNIQAAINYAVSTATDGLDYADTAESHQFVTEVDETNGVISVKRAQPTAGDIATTAVTADSTHVGIAGTDAATQITNIAAAIKSEETARANAIAALNAPDTAVDNQFVTSVSESAGVITVTRAQPAAAGVTIADSAEKFTATTVEGALAELASFDCGTY